MTNELTIFNNCIPFGLLKAEHPEIAAKLLGWDGAVEQFTHDGEWRPHVMHKVSYHAAVVYRAVKPAPTPFWVDEARLPPQVRWVAKDEDEVIWGFEEKPTLSYGMWWPGRYGRWWTEKGLCVRLDIWPGLTRPSIGVPWYESLREVKRE